MLVAIDQITSARTPGKKPKPNTLSSPVPAISVRNVIRNDISRFPSARKLVGYTGLTPKVEQSGERNRRGRLRKNGPDYRRWALIEAARTAGRDPRYRPIVERMRTRHGRKRGSKIAAIEIGRRLSEAIWHMLTHDRPFAPAGAPTLWPHDGPLRNCATGAAPTK
jgi:transposase IS116/IS110/IS902 family protein